MALPLDSASITHGIQLAVAPVFLLTAVAGMIGAVAGRLGRIIDRGRQLEDRATRSDDADYLRHVEAELTLLKKRGRLANGCIALLTTCSLLIGVTIILLFLGETAEVRTSTLAVGSFLLGVVSFLAALICFLAETVMATRTLRFRLPARRGP